MLAEHDIPANSGLFLKDVQAPNTFRYELLDFIAEQMPHWRDTPGREQVTSETNLTEQLCSHLNSAARFTDGWNCLQFIPEAGDEAGKGRKIDIAAKPCGAVITVEGRPHTHFDILLPIECKRLPAPDDKSHEEREYVFCHHSTRGGIQRFKNGHHGAAHKLVGMIGYVQEGSLEDWYTKVSAWIDDLAAAGEDGWSSADKLTYETSATKIGRYASIHTRKNELEDVSVRHLWICLN